MIGNGWRREKWFKLTPCTRSPADLRRFHWLCPTVLHCIVVDRRCCDTLLVQFFKLHGEVRPRDILRVKILSYPSRLYKTIFSFAAFCFVPLDFLSALLLQKTAIRKSWLRRRAHLKPMERCNVTISLPASLLTLLTASRPSIRAANTVAWRRARSYS